MTPNNQYGIPGGGLFNDIYAAHYSRGLGSTGSAGGTRYKSVTLGAERDDEVGCGAGCGLALLAFFIVFVILPNYLSGFGYIFALFVVPVLIYVVGRKLILDRRNANLKPVKVVVPDDSVSPDHNSETSVETYPSLFKGSGRVDLGTLKQQCRDVYEYMQRTGNVPDYVDTSVAGFSNYFGAACEVTTAKTLRGIDGCVVVNDIAITKPDGRVTANIDHLACFLSEGTTVMVDSKFWSKPPTFARRGVATHVDANGDHARAVSTCIYEASFLPVPPLAIVFAVRGKAASSLREPVSVDFYPDFDYDGNVEMKMVPFPVIFVDHTKVGQVVSDIRQGRSVAGAIARPTGRTDVLALTGQTRVGDNTLTPTTRLDFWD